MSNILYEKKTYLFILPWTLDSLGGVNQVVENLYHQMQLDDCYNPMVMVNSWDDVRIRKGLIKGIAHYFFRLRSPWNSKNKIRNFLAFNCQIIKSIRAFHNFIEKNKISVINAHYCDLFLLNVSLMKFLKIFNGKFILSFHGTDFLSVKKSKGLIRLLWKLLFRSADNIVTCSDSLRDDIIKIFPLYHSKVMSIHNGIDISSIRLSEAVGFESINKKFILNVGTLEHKKGQDILLRAFKSIVNDFDGIDLVIIGRPAGTELQIKKLISSLGLAQRVFLFEGLSHEQVMRFMQKALVFVLPSRYEPFGIVILEAGTQGVPVVASNVGGIREILSENETGRLCEPEDVVAFSKEIADLLSKPEERLRLGENLRDHVTKNFTWHQSYLKYLKCVGL